MGHEWSEWIEAFLRAEMPAGSPHPETPPWIEPPPQQAVPADAEPDHGASLITPELLARLERHRGEWRT